MKSHAFLIGINAAATLPLMLAPQAMASDNMSGTASFLKAAVGDKAVARPISGDLSSVPKLASRRMTIGRTLSPNTANLSSPQAMNARLAMSPVNGAKLRPFVAGRKLPSRSDLQSQMPQLDNSAQPNLAASINESAYAQPAASNYNSSYGVNSIANVQPSQVRSRMRQAADAIAGFQRKHAARTLPGQSPATPGQVGFPCAQQAVAPSEAEWTQMARNAGGNVQANVSNSADEADMASLAQEFAASQAPSHGTAGPAPFPLSLIPETSLKQLMGNKGAATAAVSQARPQHTAATPSYFGSWHQPQPVAHARGANLQPSGFHTYLAAGAHGSKSATTSASAFKSYAPMAYKNTRRVAPKITTTAPVVRQVVEPVVATYGAYHSPSM